MEKSVSHLMWALLIANGVTIIGFNIKPAGAWTGGTIYIRADGSIDPPSAPIETFDNITYTLMDNITSSGDGIVVERSNIIIDGAGFTVQGTGAFDFKGINITRRGNVTIMNINIESFYYAILVYNSSTIIFGNNVRNTQRGIWFVGSTGYKRAPRRTASRKRSTLPRCNSHSNSYGSWFWSKKCNPMV